MSDRVKVGSRVLLDGQRDGYGPWEVTGDDGEWVSIVRGTDAFRVRRGRVALLLRNRTTGAAEAQQTAEGAEKSQELTTTDDR